MSRSYRSIRRIVIFSICLALLLSVLPTAAQKQPIEHLIPIGGGYSDVYAGFVQAAVANARNNQVQILVLPFASAPDPFSISEEERAAQLQTAEERRFQIEEACKRAAPQDVTCQATLAPILTRSDAEDPAALKYFTDDLAAIFILDGDPAIGMQVIFNTPVELKLGEAYANGTIVAGTGAGGNLQSTALLTGYRSNFNAENALTFGAVDVWNAAGQRGLAIGIENAIIDTHFYRNNYMGRLLNAITLPGVPHVGLGLDEYTGVNAYNETRLQDVFGLYTAAILDAETYHAADAVEYAAPDNLLRLRNVLVHLISPGKFSYDLNKRVMTIGTRAQAPKARVTRDFKALTLPRKAGPLILSGDLSTTLDGNAILKRFVQLAGGDQAKVLIVTAGFPSQSLAQATAEKYAAALGVPAQIVESTQAEGLQVPEDVTGMLLIAEDQSGVAVSLLEPIKAAWANGLPLLADNAGAAVTGRSFSAHEPTPQNPDDAESAVQKSFLQGTTKLVEGMGLLDITIEPQLLNDNRWGRLFSLAYNESDAVAFGLTQNAALEITQDGARAIGENAIVALDLRTAARDLGDNNGFVIANGLLDVFTPGDAVLPSVANVNAAVTPAPTPIVPTDTPTPAPTATPINTATPAPTATAKPTTAPTRTPTPTATATLVPTPVPFGTSTSGEVLPVLPITIGAAVIFFLLVLLAGRRRK
jgi:cyanophycinase-like exopeptidase